MKIWKYLLDVTDRQIIGIPAGGRILSLQTLGEKIAMWVLVDDKQGHEQRTFRVFGTGQPIDIATHRNNMRNYVEYVGSTIVTYSVGSRSTSPLVWHVFEEYAVDPYAGLTPKQRKQHASARVT